MVDSFYLRGILLDCYGGHDDVGYPWNDLIGYDALEIELADHCFVLACVPSVLQDWKTWHAFQISSDDENDDCQSDDHSIDHHDDGIL